MCGVGVFHYPLRTTHYPLKLFRVPTPEEGGETASGVGGLFWVFLLIPRSKADAEGEKLFGRFLD